jgi:hypothetical protein
MTGWRHIKWVTVVRLTQERPDGRRWTWRKVQDKKRVRLRLVSPQGVEWDFKLNGGAWVKKHEES